MKSTFHFAKGDRMLNTWTPYSLKLWDEKYGSRDIQPNDIQHNDTRHNDTYYEGIIFNIHHKWHQATAILLNIIMLSDTFYLLLCWMSFITFSVIVLIFIMLIAIMLGVILLSVIMLNVVAPKILMVEYQVILIIKS